LASQPLKQLYAWHRQTRALGERAANGTTASPGAVDQWVMGAGLDPAEFGPADVVAAAYMVQVLHNLQSNADVSKRVAKVGPGDEYFASLVNITMTRATDLPWLKITADLSALAPEQFGDFYRTLPAYEGSSMLRGSDIEASTGL